MKTSYTIKDVAAFAGVSTATVSNVLHGKKELFTPETAQRVRKVIEELGYRPNHVARSLVRRRTHTLGAVIEPIHGISITNPFISGILDGLVFGAVSSGYQIKIIMLVKSEPDYEVSQVEDASVDGVALIAPRTDSVLLEWAQHTRKGAILVGGVAPESGLACIDMDDTPAIYNTVRYLVEQGHRHIGIITGPPWQWSARRREDGYRAALQDAGIRFDPSWRYEGDYTPESGQRGIQELLKSTPRVTAVLCGNDHVALAALETLHQQGVSVPEEISLVGLGDIEAARWSRPPLTTIRQPTREIGRQAAQALIHQIETEKPEPAITLLPGELIRRDSVAPILAPCSVRR